MTSLSPQFLRVFASLASGLAAAALAHVITVLAFFVANGAAPGQLLPVSDFFFLSSAMLFVLLSLAAYLGANTFRYTALAAGAVAGVLAAILGTLFTYLLAGNPVVDELLPLILGTLGGSNLVFVVAAIIAAATAGIWAWHTVIESGSRRPSGTQRTALVRIPASNLADGQLTHVKRKPVDAELADEQWETYVDALRDAGFTIVEVPAADTLPDSVFVEDTVVILGDVAVITSPGADSRRDEILAVDDSVAELGLDVRRIELPGTLDGGDVLKIGRTIYVGRGGRTNADGIRQFREIANAEGYTVVAVPVSKVLHLKSAVTALPDGTVIGYPPLVEHPELFDRFLAVPEETGAAVVVLDDDSLLMSASAPKTALLFEDLGYRVTTVDISEFEKLEGCVTCLSVRIR